MRVDTVLELRGVEQRGGADGAAEDGVLPDAQARGGLGHGVVPVGVLRRGGAGREVEEAGDGRVGLLGRQRGRVRHFRSEKKVIIIIIIYIYTK